MFEPPECVKASSFLKSHMSVPLLKQFLVIKKKHLLLQNPLPHRCLLHLLVPRTQMFLFGAKQSTPAATAAAILSQPDLHMLDALHLTRAVSSCAVAATVPPEPWTWQEGAVPSISGTCVHTHTHIYIYISNKGIISLHEK